MQAQSSASSSISLVLLLQLRHAALASTPVCQTRKFPKMTDLEFQLLDSWQAPASLRRCMPARSTADDCSAASGLTGSVIIKGSALFKCAERVPFAPSFCARQWSQYSAWEGTAGQPCPQAHLARRSSPAYEHPGHLDRVEQKQAAVEVRYEQLRCCCYNHHLRLPLKNAGLGGSSDPCRNILRSASRSSHTRGVRSVPDSS